MRIFKSSAVAAALLATSGAFAAQITQIGAPIGLSEFFYFDSRLGTLTSAKLTATLSVGDVIYTFENRSADPASAYGTSKFEIKYEGLGGSFRNAGYNTASGTIDAGTLVPGDPYNGYYSSIIPGISDISDGSEGPFINSVDLNLFDVIGVSTDYFNFYGEVSYDYPLYDYGGSDDLRLLYGDGGGFYGGSLSLTYTYAAAVPEPETYALMLAGLAVVGATAKRRRKNT